MDVVYVMRMLVCITKPAIILMFNYVKYTDVDRHK